MKFPRHAQILRSRFDVAPFAIVLFLLVFFLLLAALLPVPGLRLRLEPPAAANLPGVDAPTVALALDAQGNLYFANRRVSEPELTNQLAAAVAAATAPLTLIIHADKVVTYDQLTHLALLARTAGITNSLLATLPRAEAVPAATP